MEYCNFEDTDTASRPTSKLRSHECANTNFSPLKIYLCEHNKFFSSKIWIFNFFVVTLQREMINHALWATK